MPEAMRAVTLPEFGGVDTLTISQIPKVAITKGTDVLIKVMAAGINQADVSQRMGHYPPPQGVSEILGLEVSGIVEAVGAEVQNVKVGDRVMALLSGGGYAEYAVSHEGAVMPIPEGYSFVEAAAIPETFLTAWQALYLQMNVQAGEYVLIHAGASGVGTAASQLVEKYFKATAVTTSSESKVEVCKKFASVCVSRTPDADGASFAPKIIAAIGPDKINAVIDPIFGGTYINENAAVLGVGGRIVVLAFLGGSTPTVNGHLLFAKEASIIFSRLRSKSDEYKTHLTTTFIKNVLPLFSKEHMRAVVSQTFPLEKVAEAHAAMEGNTTWGKIVLTLEDKANEK